MGNMNRPEYIVLAPLFGTFTLHKSTFGITLYLYNGNDNTTHNLTYVNKFTTHRITDKLIEIQETIALTTQVMKFMILSFYSL